MGYQSKYTGSQLENILDNAQNKQDKIADLDVIRSGASKGATALQSIPSEYITEAELNDKGYVTISALDNKVDRDTLATVATSGSYNDLSNKPTIPSAVTESTVSGWGFTKNTGTYSKPSTGIPKSDLDSTVQTSLGKADAAVSEQRADEKYIKKSVWDDLVIAEADGIFSNEASLYFALPNTNNGDEDDVLLSRESVKTINGESIFGSGDIDTRPYITNFSYEELQSIGNKQTSVQQELIEALREQRPILVPMSLTSDLGYYHASGYVEDLIYLTIYGDYGVVYYLEVDYTNSLELNPSNVIRKEFQNKLNSGTNIKTINGESILGSGDIEISGGSGGGEDIRYFTEFTVEDFIEACEQNSTIEVGALELMNAANDNKIICVPYAEVEKGYLIASIKHLTSSTQIILQTNFSIYIGVAAYENDRYYIQCDYPETSSSNTIFTTSLIIELQDNTTYIIMEPINDIITLLMQNMYSTVRFKTDSSVINYSLDIYGPGEVMWANGVVPEIEPDTNYELSLAMQYEGSILAVLTPFKPVE